MSYESFDKDGDWRVIELWAVTHGNGPCQLCDTFGLFTVYYQWQPTTTSKLTIVFDRHGFDICFLSLTGLF